MGTRFGDMARQARVNAEVSLRDLANRLGFTPAYISDIERGNRYPPAVEVLHEWADAIGVDSREFELAATIERPSIELRINGTAKRGELAMMLARSWEEMSEEDEERLIEVLEKLRNRRHGGER